MIVGVIPARGGSKGIPRKNIKLIAGYPLIYWSIEAARQSSLLDDFYVSTDDDEIAETAKMYGAKVLKRPEALAQDDTTTLEVLRHIAKEMTYSAIVVLQPTSPLRDEGLIDECVREYLSGNYDTLATGHNCKITEYATHKNMRRQDIPGFFYDDGNVYIIDRDIILENRWTGDRICRKVLDKELNFEIDDPIDFFIVESILRKRISEGKQCGALHSRLSKIKMLIMDVDGVHTDTGMYYSENGDELKKFNTRDGKGIELIRDKGFLTAFITGEETELVRRRAAKLKIDFVFQGIRHKSPILDEILDRTGLDAEQVAYIGDDVNDIDVMQRVGLAITTRDGAAQNKRIADYETKAKGGEGAVREVCDMLLEVRGSLPGQWPNS